MKKPIHLAAAFVSVSAFGALAGSATAGTSTYSAKSGGSSAKGGHLTEAAPHWCDTLWAIPHLYSNDNAFWLTDLKLTGRYQLQYAHVNSDQGNFDDWESRRLRIGGEAKILGGDWKVKAEININEDLNPFYDGIDEAYIQYAPSKAFKLTIGKQKPKWSYEWATSSRKILTFERSLLVNQLLADKSSGVNASGTVNGWDYSLGIYSGDLTNDEFGNFDAGVFALASIGQHYSDDASWRLDYLYNGDSNNDAAAAYRHSVSLNHSYQAGAFGLHTDLIYADGFESDAYGVVILPTYDISDKLQFVSRYTYAHGDNDSLTAQKRYERAVPHITDGGKGEDYHSIYAGLNYYICDHKLKLMTGVEYSDLSDSKGDGGDFEGFTVFSGMRFYF